MQSMEDKLKQTISENLTRKRKKQLFIVALVGLVILLLFTQFTGNERSVSAFCQAFRAEDTKLEDADGDTYSLSFFDHRSSDPKDFAVALKNLERSAPEEIRSDVETLRKTFETIDEDPSQAFAASLGAIGPEDAVKKWTAENCSDPTP